MFNVNEYFDGKVKSLAFTNIDDSITIGVMATGEYEFGTSTVEHMTVTSGSMKVLLQGETAWKVFGEYETFVVEKDTKFKVIVEDQTSYKCVYS
ncbi:MAG: pyrimidine/purine nucleoside phosphorylase [Bacteroidetes bacterium]|nr:pyrimidine/purine nucleoside phosphorylase [Bacteroidota bacterium]